MAGVTFANADQLRTHLDLDAATLPDAKANERLEAVSEEIRDKLGWSVTQETGVTVTVDGPGVEALYLPTRFLTAVTSVVEDALALALNTDYVFSVKGYLRRRAGDANTPGRWIRKRDAVLVTITHGYPTGQVPTIFRTVALEYASAALPNPARLRSLQVGGVTQSFEVGNAGDDPRLNKYRLLQRAILLA